MRIKVCGMKEAENIEGLSNLDIDFIGFIFYKKSPRFINESLNISDFRYLKKVGVFVDADIDYVQKMAFAKKLDYVQLHGTENIFYCQQLKKEGLKIIKAFSVDENFSFTITQAYKYFVDYFLFDTKGKNPGGNGFTFDWQLLKNYKEDIPFFLSGGISEDNVKEIKSLKLKNLYGLDLNSKFEIEPGLKDINKIKNFIHELRN